MSRAGWHRRTGAVVLAWLGAAAVVTLVHREVPAAGWLMVHLLLLGAVSNALLVWSGHFTEAVLRLPAATTRRAPALRLVAFNAGAIGVVAGVVAGQAPLVVAGGVLAGVAVGWHVLALLAGLRQSLPSRFAVTVHYYVAAGLLALPALGLGVLLSQGVGDEARQSGLLLAHATLGILGWIGIPILGTLVTLWPTMLRTQIAENAQRRARTALPGLVAGTLVVAAGLMLGQRLLAVVGLVLYAAAAGWTLAPMVDEMRRRPPASFATWSTLAGVGWLAIALAGFALALVRAPEVTSVTADGGGLTAAAVVGGVLQVLLGSLSYLMPVMAGGGPQAVRVRNARADRGLVVRLVVTNLGLAICLLPVPSAVRVTTSIAVLISLIASGWAVAATLRTPRAPRTPQPDPASSTRPAPAAKSGATAQPGGTAQPAPAPRAGAAPQSAPTTQPGAAAASETATQPSATLPSAHTALPGAAAASGTATQPSATPPSAHTAQPGATPSSVPTSQPSATPPSAHTAQPGATPPSAPSTQSPATRRPTPTARPEQQPSGAIQRHGAGLVAGLAALVLAVVAGVAVDPAALGAASSGVAPASAGVTPTGHTTEVSVTVHGMRYDPASISVPAGDVLVITLTNTGDDVHDLTIETGQSTPRLRPGESATLDLGVVGRSLDGWCSVAGHRQLGMVLAIDVVGGATQDDAGSADGDHSAHGTDPEGGGGAGSGSGSDTPAPDLMAEPGPEFSLYDARLAPAADTRTHKVTLEVTEKVVEVAPGVRQTRWMFGGSAPGPVLRGRVGDTFVVTLVNSGTIGHSIDFHAGALAPDGPMRTIVPGEQLEYRFTATKAGIWMYHCSTMPMSMHIANGLYGAVIIDPPDLAPVDQEFVLVQSEGYLGEPDGTSDADAIAAGQPDLVTFNGYPMQYDHHPLTVKVGERVRIWVLDAGPNRSSSFHVVGGQFDTVFREGAFDLRPGTGGAQALGLFPAQGGFVELTLPEAGHYPFVTHAMSDAERGAHGILEAAAG